MVYFILEKISKNYPNSSVMILSRYKRERDKIKKKLNKINAKELFGFEKITCYTLHESKGMQADNVIILNVNSIPFSSTFLISTLG